MTYVLTIYFISTFGFAAIQGLTPDLNACESNAVEIISALDLPPSVVIRVECSSTVEEIEV